MCAVRAEPARLDQCPRRSRPGTHRRLTPRERVEVRDEFWIGRGDSHDAMPQCRRLVVDEAGRHGVQLDAPRRAELLVHGGLHQRMAERDVPDGEVLADLQQVQIDRLVQSLDRLLHVGQHARPQKARRSPPRTAAASTSRRAPGLQASSLETTRMANAPGAGSIGSHVRHRSFGISDKKCRDVQRVALGVGVQLSGDPRRQLRHTQRVGETLDLARRKRAESRMVAPVRPPAIRWNPSGSRETPSLRCARTVSTRSPTRRRTTNSSARRESTSAQCASSIDNSDGRLLLTDPRAPRGSGRRPRPAPRWAEIGPGSPAASSC